jgi:hypothetical protein
MMVVSSLKDMTALIGRVAARFMGIAVGSIHKDRLIISAAQWVWIHSYSRSFRKWSHCWRLFVMICNRACLLWIQDPWQARWLIPQQVLTVIEIKEIGDCSLAWFRSMGLQAVMKMQELERPFERSVLAPRVCTPQLLCQELQQFNHV